MYSEIKVRHLNKIRIGDNSAECRSTCSKEQDSLLKFDSSRDRLCTGAVRMPGRVGLSFACIKMEIGYLFYLHVPSGRCTLNHTNDHNCVICEPNEWFEDGNRYIGTHLGGQF